MWEHVIKDETWIAEDAAARPLVNLTNLDHSPAAQVAVEYVNMLLDDPKESLALLHGSLVTYIAFLLCKKHE